MEVNWGLMRSFGMFHLIHDIMLLDVLSSSETLLVEKKKRYWGSGAGKTIYKLRIFHQTILDQSRIAMFCYLQ